MNDILWNQRVRESDTVDVTKNTPNHHINERKIQKKIKKDKTNEEKNSNDISSIVSESEDEQSSFIHNDKDCDVSFENDTEKEIDTTEIQEEDWIDYIKRSTNDVIEKMGSTKIRYWNKTHKIEMETDGRPWKRWEDDINEFLKLFEDETENFTDEQKSNQQNIGQERIRQRKMNFNQR